MAEMAGVIFFIFIFVKLSEYFLNKKEETTPPRAYPPPPPPPPPSAARAARREVVYVPVNDSDPTPPYGIKLE